MTAHQMLATYMATLSSKLKLANPSISELAEAIENTQGQSIWCVDSSQFELIPLRCGVSPKRLQKWIESSSLSQKLGLFWIDTQQLTIEKISAERAEQLIYQVPDIPELTGEQLEIAVVDFLHEGLSQGYFGQLTKPAFDVNCLSDWERYFHSVQNHVMVAFVRKAERLYCHQRVNERSISSFA